MLQQPNRLDEKLVRRAQAWDCRKHNSLARRLPLLACGILISLSFFSAANAHSGGGGHGGGGGSHFGGGGHVGGGYGRYGGGYGGRYGGGYGGRYGGGYGGGWGRYGFGFGAGLGLGLYFSTLPFYYSTYWWGGIPYYYADETYYTWDGSAGEYETINPPPEVEQQAQAQAASSELIAYPKNGQSDQQQAKDKSECREWAVTQSGYNPAGATASADSNRGNYLRAQAACLDGRGYSVR